MEKEMERESESEREGEMNGQRKRKRKRERQRDKKRAETENAVYRRRGHGEYKIKTCHGRSPPLGCTSHSIGQCGSYAQISCVPMSVACRCPFVYELNNQL